MFLQRSHVLNHSGGNPRLLSRLLNDAQVIESMAENHKNVVKHLKLLVLSLSALQQGSWKLSDKPLEEIQKEVDIFNELGNEIDKLDDKSRGIIQLVGLFYDYSAKIG